MKVELLNYTPLWIADKAISKCWDKPFDKDNVNYEKIQRIANQYKHSSTIEHIYYNFDIDAVSRALLQELARHRIASPSVKSTRYTLKELKDTSIPDLIDFLVPTNSETVDNIAFQSLIGIKMALEQGISNDIVKYALPESFKTSLVWSINARSLQNFLSLRSSKAALWEIRELANAIFEVLPDEHKFLFEEFVAKQ